MTVYCGDRRIAGKVRLADTFSARFMGLMGKKHLDEGEGLLLKNCPSIHCFFMRIAIDAVYLLEDMTVLGVETLKPWRIGGRFKGTAHVLELAAGSSELRAGDVLRIENE